MEISDRDVFSGIFVKIILVPKYEKQNRENNSKQFNCGQSDATHNFSVSLDQRRRKTEKERKADQEHGTGSQHGRY